MTAYLLLINYGIYILYFLYVIQILSILSFLLYYIFNRYYVTYIIHLICPSIYIILSYLPRASYPSISSILLPVLPMVQMSSSVFESITQNKVHIRLKVKIRVITQHCYNLWYWYYDVDFQKHVICYFIRETGSGWGPTNMAAYFIAREFH